MRSHDARQFCTEPCLAIRCASWLPDSSFLVEFYHIPADSSNRPLFRWAATENIQPFVCTSFESSLQSLGTYFIFGACDESQYVHMLRPQHMSPFDVMLLRQRHHHQCTERFVTVAAALKLIQKRNVQILKVEFLCKKNIYEQLSVELIGNWWIDV